MTNSSPDTTEAISASWRDIVNGQSRRIRTVTVLLTLVASSGWGQETPAVLSTTPDLPPGVVAVPAEMSGQPLQVGDLPPGIVVVRVIRRTFSENVIGKTVTLLESMSGQVHESLTDANGRAQFADLSIGTVVEARATVDQEPLVSQAFALPAQGGVRLVLVAGVGATAPASFSALASVAAHAQSTAGTTPPGGGRATDPALIASVVLGASALTLGTVWWRRRRVNPDECEDDGLGALPLDTEPPPTIVDSDDSNILTT
jgi:hypothetical protein